jgi:hypothetical protein
MVTGLEPKLAPDEKVLYRAHHGLGQIARQVFISIVLLAAWMIVGWGGFIMLFRPDDGVIALFFSHYWIEISIVLILFVAAILAVTMWRGAAAVTNHRLLYRSGFFRATIREVPLQEIKGLDLSPGLMFKLGEFLSVHRRGMGAIRVEQAPELPRLWRELAVRTDLPAPPAAVAKIRAAYRFLGAFEFVCGCAVMIGWGAYLLHSFQSDTWLLTTLFESFDSDSLLFPVYLVLFMAIPVLSVPLGMKVGVILALVVVRGLFTFAEARDMACMGYEAAGRHPLCGAQRRFHRFCQRFLGLLYGQTIRCD